MTIPASNEGFIYVGVQSQKGTAQTTLYRLYLTDFSFEPDIAQDEGEAVIGRGMDVDQAERWGSNGATIKGSMRFRPGNVGYLLKAFGLACTTTGAGPYTHTFKAISAASSFPYLTILDKFDASATLDVQLKDVWINSLTITANERDALRLEFEGRALSWTTTIGTPTLNDEPTGLLTPNTSKGTLTFASAAYKLNTMKVVLAWGEALATSLTVATVEQVIVQGRNVTGQADVFLGANASLWESVYQNGGTTFSTAITQGDLEATFQSGGVIPTETDPFAVQLGLPETRFLTYPLAQSGDDPIKGGLTFQVTRITSDWSIVLTNGKTSYA
jgi:hypothetical protein